MKKKIEKKFIFIVAILTVLTALFLSRESYAATVSAVVDCNNELCDVSHYIFGQNTSSVYYKAPLTNQTVIDTAKKIGIKMWRFFPGAAGQRYDYRYNNYKGKYWSGGDPLNPWRFEPDFPVPSVEDELRFCNAIGAEPLVEVNTAFVGPNGTHYDDAGTWTGGDDFHSYTGCESISDTPENRAQYGAGMVSHIRDLCDINGWDYPVHYTIGNETGWDSQPYAQYIDCCLPYSAAMKAVDPNINVSFSCIGVSPHGDITDMYDMHPYAANNATFDSYVYSPGGEDGSFLILNNRDTIGNVLNNYASTFPGVDPVLSWSEWGDHSYDTTKSYFTEYRGAIFTAHMFYRGVKNKIFLSCAWGCWSDWNWDYQLFGEPPEFKIRPRGFAYQIYKNFGDRLLECYDPREYTPGVTDYFRDYKDDWDSLLVQASKRNADGAITVMAINLSDTESYDTQITLENFDMGGEIEVHTMNNATCYEGGPGPSMNTLTGQSNPINYTFAPFTATCLVVKGESGTGGGGEEDDELDAKVYPNPVSGGGQITFSVGGATGGEVKIYTLSGKLVKELVIQSGASEVDWDVLNEDGNSITTGLYLYTIIDGAGNKKTGKLAISD
jgi:hypothetical protein